jgi:hypothetical protein
MKTNKALPVSKQIGKIKVVKDHCGTYLFQSTKSFQTVPKILREYYQEDAEGKPLRMYECEENRHFIADVYDRNFVAKKSKPVRNKYYKGKNPNFQLVEEEDI